MGRKKNISCKRISVATTHVILRSVTGGANETRRGTTEVWLGDETNKSKNKAGVVQSMRTLFAG